MTTIIDPTGTPIVVFNRGGVALIPLTIVTTGPDQITNLPSIAGRTIIVATITGTDAAVLELPASPDIGDTIEIYVTGGASAHVVPGAGDDFLGGNPSDWITLSAGVSAIFTKLPGDAWGFNKSPNM